MSENGDLEEGQLEMKERVEWVDTAKLFGMFAIYIGHFGTFAGRIYPFVFAYHVPLFFFLSGCMEYYAKEIPFHTLVMKKAKRILFPYVLFCLLSIVVYTLQTQIGIGEVRELLYIVAKGCIRNTFFGSALWFLTCLFCVEVLFRLFRFFRFKPLIFAACCGCYALASFVVQPHPLAKPHMWYNFDSALYYMLYYGIGYVGYPYLLRLFRWDRPGKVWICVLTGGISILYAASVFFGKDIFDMVFPGTGAVQMVLTVLKVLILIWFNLVLARFLEGLHVFAEFGRESLFLCGNEYVIKAVVQGALGFVGLNLQFGELSACLYTVCLLICCTRYLIPFEKKICRKIQENLSNGVSPKQEGN